MPERLNEGLPVSGPCDVWAEGCCPILKHAAPGAIYRACDGIYSPERCVLENDDLRKNVLALARKSMSPTLVERSSHRPTKPQTILTVSRRIGQFPQAN